MAKFLLTYHGDSSMPDTEAGMAELMTAWQGWFGSIGDGVVDGGAPVGDGYTVASDGSASAGGGANPVTGYSILEAADMAAATKLAAGCPVLAGGGSVEVSPIIDL